jgi:RHS repeat-associated protein
VRYPKASTRTELISQSFSSPIYLRARYYDPSTRQFLTRDPLVTLTRAPYSYVGDNPLNLTDPSGQWGFLDGCGRDNRRGGSWALPPPHPDLRARSVAV